ncbi:MAG: branched-chain amino acid ABC transporter permease [Candidatus Hodarchaeales archaeon]|jgi:branched-subunit amino acid ABC-type transport system permease component
MSFIPIDVVSHVSLAIIYASTLILLTVGLNMVYSVMKFSNFAHAEFITFGMFTSWWFLQILTFAIPWDSSMFLINNLIFQALFAFVMVGLLGILCELLVFGRLKRLAANPRSFTVASIGIGLVIRNFLAMIFGNFPKPKTGGTSDSMLPFNLNIGIQQYFTRNHPIFGSQGIFITSEEVLIILMSVTIVVIIDYMFKKTKIGVAMRATSDSYELAQVSGINTKHIIFYTWFLAAGLTGFGAAFLRANQPRFSTLDGFIMLLPIFAVVILGGVGSFQGGIISAFIISFARQSTVILFTILQSPGGLEEAIERIFYDLFGVHGITITIAPGYADGIGFLILIIVLLFRPQGIFGKVEATRSRV